MQSNWESAVNRDTGFDLGRSVDFCSNTQELQWCVEVLKKCLMNLPYCACKNEMFSFIGISRSDLKDLKCHQAKLFFNLAETCAKDVF